MCSAGAESSRGALGAARAACSPASQAVEPLSSGRAPIALSRKRTQRRSRCTTSSIFHAAAGSIPANSGLNVSSPSAPRLSASTSPRPGSRRRTRHPGGGSRHHTTARTAHAVRRTRRSSRPRTSRSGAGCGVPAAPRPVPWARSSPRGRSDRAWERARIGTTDLDAARSVLLPTRRHPGREEPVGETDGTGDAPVGRAADVDRHRVLHRSGRDPHRRAPDTRRARRSAQYQERNELVKRVTAQSVVDTERPEVVLDVADPEADVEPAVEAEVGDRDLLGQTDRVVEQREDDRDPHADVPGHGPDGAGDEQRRRDVPVGRLMVLAQPDAIEALVVGPAAHLEQAR